MYHDAAAELGRALAKASRVVVYGGGGTGSMGALASGALEAGGFVVGIQPRFMAELDPRWDLAKAVDRGDFDPREHPGVYVPAFLLSE